ncbi:MAG: PAS domain S-box protein [Clostridia bacterium]
MNNKTPNEKHETEPAKSLAKSNEVLLRQRAEKFEREKARVFPANTESMTPAEIEHTFQELQIYRIELEMQNEELRKTQAELDKVRARYFDLYELAPVGYMIISEKSMILAANLKATSLFGLARSKLLKQPLSRFILPEDQDIYYHFRKELCEGQEPGECDLRLLKKDGTSCWVNLAGTATKIDGELTCRLVLSDINKRKQAEAELVESEERFQLLFNKAPLGYQSLDFDGCFLDVNHEWLDMLGYKSEEVLGKWFGDFLSPAYQEGFRQRFPLFKAQGHIHSEFEMVHKKGDKLFIAFEGKIGYDTNGKFKQTHCILKDITIEKRLAKELRDSRALMQAIINSTTDAIYVKDMLGRYMLFNSAAEKIVGKSAAEVLGKDDYNIFPAAEASMVIEGDRKILKEQKVSTYEEIVTTALGNNANFLSTKGPIYDDNQQLTGLFGVARNITDIRLKEANLRESEEKYRNIFTVESDALFIIDIETGTIVDANMAACSLYGYSYEELLQLKNTDMSAEPKQTKQATQNLQDGQTTIPLRWHKKKDGTIFPVEIVANMFILKNRKVHIVAIRDITEREQAEAKLKISEVALKKQNDLFSSLLKIIPVGVFMVEAPSGKPILANEAAKQILGRGILPDASTDNLSEVYKAYKLDSKEHYPPEEMPIILGMKGATSHIDDMLVERPDGTKTVIEIFGSPLFDEQGQIKASLVSFLDITERKQAEKALRQSEEKYKLLYTSMDQGAALHEIITDADGKPIDYIFLDINASYTRLLGVTREAIGKRIREVMPEVEQYWIDVFGKVAQTGEPSYYENYLVTTGKYYATYAYSPKKNQFAVLVSDITDRIKKSEEILYLSYHDQLTGLYNRRFYEEELKRLDTERNLPLTIAMGDVNGLKLVNDSFGHTLGDALLQKVAEILKVGCRADDIIARLGGDEFVIILPNTDVVEAEQVINRINDLAVKEKVGNLDISISFGYEAKTKKQEDLQEVFKAAENHMYRNKLHESSSMRSKTVNLIMSTLYENNHREMHHSLRVSELCGAIAMGLKLEQEQVKQIKIAGLMHDIGKIGIAEKIRNSAELNQDERNEIRRHSEIGYRILSSVSEFSEIATFVLEHQERWDGNGYPRGLQGAEISLPARIITLADAFDAMTGERTYGKALDSLAAIAEIKRCAGTQFDPALVKVFIEEVLEKGVNNS